MFSNLGPESPQKNEAASYTNKNKISGYNLQVTTLIRTYHASEHGDVNAHKAFVNLKKNHFSLLNMKTRTGAKGRFNICNLQQTQSLTGKLDPKASTTSNSSLNNNKSETNN